MRGFLAILRRDVLLAIRHPGDCLNPLMFFAVLVVLFPLGVDPEGSILRVMAPGVIWIAVLLAGLFSLEGLFRSDFEDGSLEQMVLSPESLPLLVLGKVTAHWTVTGLPMLLCAPVLALFLTLPPAAIATLEWTLLVGTPVLSLIGSVGVALTVGLRRGGILLSLLVMPLYIPLLIFATQAVSLAAGGLPVDGALDGLHALFFLSLSLAPLAGAAALRISLS